MTKTESSSTYCHNCKGARVATLPYTRYSYNTYKKGTSTARQSQPQIEQQPRQIHKKKEYSTTGKTDNDDLTSNDAEQEIRELLGLIQIIKKLRNERRGCDDKLQKVQIIFKYIDEF